jgi:hypothetical protein
MWQDQMITVSGIDSKRTQAVPQQLMTFAQIKKKWESSKTTPHIQQTDTV